MEFMVARGHCLDTLLNVYPISTLRAMIAAAGHNRREEIAIETQGEATAILHGLDCGFNKGKGKLLQKFMKQLFKKDKREKTKDIQDVEDKLFNFFAPSVKRK
jgi:hypothetical protein